MVLGNMAYIIEEDTGTLRGVIGEGNDGGRLGSGAGRV